jgi:hypothetical protein
VDFVTAESTRARRSGPVFVLRCPRCGMLCTVGYAETSGRVAHESCGWEGMVSGFPFPYWAFEDQPWCVPSSPA